MPSRIRFAASFGFQRITKKKVSSLDHINACPLLPDNVSKQVMVVSLFFKWLVSLIEMYNEHNKRSLWSRHVGEEGGLGFVDEAVHMSIKSATSLAEGSS